MDPARTLRERDIDTVVDQNAAGLVSTLRMACGVEQRFARESREFPGAEILFANLHPIHTCRKGGSDLLKESGWRRRVWQAVPVRHVAQNW